MGFIFGYDAKKKDEKNKKTKLFYTWDFNFSIEQNEYNVLSFKSNHLYLTVAAEVPIFLPLT